MVDISLAGYVYFHSPTAHENRAACLGNISPYHTPTCVYVHACM